MSIVKIKDKRIGVTYVYEQQKSVWDPEKKQARSKRILLGKLDEKTGETVPTKNWGRNRKREEDYRTLYKNLKKELQQLMEENSRLRIENAQLRNSPNSK